MLHPRAEVVGLGETVGQAEAIKSAREGAGGESQCLYKREQARTSRHEHEQAQ